MCTAGTYVNATGATECVNCDAGYTSSKMKDRCSPCDDGTYSVGDGTTCQSCNDVAECPCVAIPGPCFTVSLKYNFKKCSVFVWAYMSTSIHVNVQYVVIGCLFIA